eukprot:jgi/Mesvir1/8853/Mv02749-RA.1
MSRNPGAWGGLPIPAVLDVVRNQVLGISLGSALLAIMIRRWKMNVVVHDRLFRIVVHAVGAGFDVSKPFDPIRAKSSGPKGKLLVMSDRRERVALYNSNNLVEVPSDTLLIDGNEQGVRRTTQRSSLVSFEQMVQQTARNASVGYMLPNGNFDSLFRFSHSLRESYSEYSSFEVFLNEVNLYTLQLKAEDCDLLLAPEVERALPACWDPAALAEFIKKYGTHVVKGVTVGSSNGFTVRQKKTAEQAKTESQFQISTLLPGKFGIGTTGRDKSREGESKEERMEVFQEQRGGDGATGGSPGTTAPGMGEGLANLKATLELEFGQKDGWLESTKKYPAAIHMRFVPIADLVKDKTKRLMLHRAVNIYIGMKSEIRTLAADLARFADISGAETYRDRELDGFWRTHLRCYDREYISCTQTAVPATVVGVPVSQLKVSGLDSMDGLHAVVFLGDTLFCGAANEDKQQQHLRAYTPRMDKHHPGEISFEEMSRSVTTKRSSLAPLMSALFPKSKDRAVTALCAADASTPLLLFCAGGNVVYLVNEQGDEVGQLQKNNSKSVLSLASSPDGMWVITGDRGGTITLYERVTEKGSTQWRPSREFKHKISKVCGVEEPPVVALTMTPDGLAFASLASDGVLYRRKPRDAHETKVHMFDRGARVPTSLVITWKWLAIGFGDGSISVHQLSDHATEDLKKLQDIEFRGSRGTRVQKLIWSEASNTLFVSYACGAVAGWERVQGWQHHHLRWSVQHSRDLTTALALKDDLLVTADTHGEVHAWKVPLPKY